MKKIKYLIGLICLICLIWPISARPALAAGPATNSLDNFQKAVKVGNNAQEFVGVNTLANIMNGITSFIVGDTSCTPEMQQKKQCDTGALGAVGGMIAFMYEAPPLSSREYIADLGSNLGLTPKSAYAVGDGWKVLAPVMDLWKLMRNLTYLMFTIIFVVIGFMIMFRAKMGPAAVTIQMAIPKIVMSLILVTFSYAIAGFIVDLAFIANDLIRTIFISPTIGLVPGGSALTKSDIGYLVTGVSQKIIDLRSNLLSIITLDPSGLINFAFAMTVFSTSMQIFLAMLTKYINVVISVIFLPLQIMISVISEKDGPFSWVKSYASSVFAFPVMFFGLNLMYYFLLVSIHIETTHALTLGLVTLPGFVPIPPSPLDQFVPGGAPAPWQIAAATYKVVALGIFLMLPKILDAVDNAFGAKAGVTSGATNIGAGLMRRIPVVGSFLG